MMDAPQRPVGLGPYEARITSLAGGGWLLGNAQALTPYAQRYTEALQRWAHERPAGVFLAERDGSGAWRALNYADALSQVLRLAQALVSRGLSAERPVAVLSGNGIEHALLALAALHVGVPVAPVSPAYALLDTSGARLRHAMELLTPGLVFADDGDAFGAAITRAVPAETEVVLLRPGQIERPHTRFEALQAAPPTEAVARAHAAVGPDTVAKFIFTSGSTNLPKAVVNTHRMLCSNMQMHNQCYPFVIDEPPVMVDWLPWHHTAGGNVVFGLALVNGGTLYIDHGKPTDSGLRETLRNLREVSPTLYFTVPKGLESLAHAMQGDDVLRDRFFRRLRLIFPAGAALPRNVQDAVQALAVQSVGQRIAMTTGLGMTETAPFALTAHVPDWQAGMIGIPAPGLTVKLAPVGDRLEVRYRGPNVTPGYWRAPEVSQQAFDDEGYFRSGDAARFVDEAQPARGLRFDGRTSEDFKLNSGTWAQVGALRHAVVEAGAPYVQDAVITGHGRDELGLLIFLWPRAADLSGKAGASLAELAADAGVRAWMQALLNKLAREAKGSSARFTRALLLDAPPSMALGEITDKGSINQRAVLQHRAAWVEALYADDVPDARVLRAAP
jgi:feruloyl-CoA synthase